MNAAINTAASKPLRPRFVKTNIPNLSKLADQRLDVYGEVDSL